MGSGSLDLLVVLLVSSVCMFDYSFLNNFHSLYSLLAVETGSYSPPVSDLGGDISSFISFFSLDVQDIFQYIVSDVVCNPVFLLVVGFVFISVGVNLVRVSIKLF